MAFILSKVLLFLLFPITWVFILFIVALVTKNPKPRRQLLWAGLIVLYLFSIPILLDIYAKLWRYPQPPLTKQNYSCAIVLGGFSSKGIYGGYFNGASDRFIEGVRLYKMHIAQRILISSGSGSLFPHGFHEADWVHGPLKQFGVPDSSILIEDKSRNTVENARFSKKILDARHIKGPYLLVTSDFHMRRSMLIFKKAGLDVVPYRCNYIAGIGDTDLDSFLPDGGVFATWGIYIKELVGTIVAWVSKI